MKLYEDSGEIKNPGERCVWCRWVDCDERIQEKQYGVPANEMKEIEHSKAETCLHFGNIDEYMNELMGGKHIEQNNDWAIAPGWRREGWYILPIPGEENANKRKDNGI